MPNCGHGHYVQKETGKEPQQTLPIRRRTPKQIIPLQRQHILGQKVTFDYPAEVRFQCTKCGICCGDTKEKTRHILLLTAEAAQIATATSQPIAEFAVKIDGKAPYSHEMKKTLENGKCIFLSQNRCTIYPLRPLICRFYPFELKIATNQKHQFLHTNECPSIGKGKPLSKNYFEELFQLAHAKTQPQHKPKNKKH
jgi:Fe-S-cluster containining protein